MSVPLIVTGVDGFVGRHVARLGASAGWSITGISRADRPDRSLSPFLDRYICADLTQSWPSGLPHDAPVIHLAGLSAVGPSFVTPQRYLDQNSAMTTHLCEARLSSGSGAPIIGVSTGAVYAADADESMHRETDRLEFTSPYVVSKVLVENQLAYYRRRGVSTVVVRPFNHIGPGQRTGFLVPDLLARLKRISPGAELSVGNLKSRRDYTDVRDVARAYLALASTPSLTDSLFNVASGSSRSGEEILGLLCGALEIAVPPVVVDVDRVRPDDPAVITGDASRLREAVGWAPSIPLEQTIEDIVRDSISR